MRKGKIEGGKEIKKERMQWSMSWNIKLGTEKDWESNENFIMLNDAIHNKNIDYEYLGVIWYTFVKHTLKEIQGESYRNSLSMNYYPTPSNHEEQVD